MRNSQLLINVQNVDGAVRRIPRIEAEDLVATGAWSFTDNNTWRAFKKSQATKSKKAEARQKVKAEKEEQSEKDKSFSEGIL